MYFLLNVQRLVILSVVFLHLKSLTSEHDYSAIQLILCGIYSKPKANCHSQNL